ncbi:hypothetical protein CFOL_v3_20445 [Cephalotus follicularis]|uniref:RVT_2 domain-containing protein n=1 Tax=Cephalotus follicularis TaxID=3775 RepID=A0A1Q3CA22_CEPFO|nr:hypothetical protein CFOL_v3_20445 [Cephalotus follicularis]
MDHNMKLFAFTFDAYFSDPARYRHLVGKLIYLTMTRLDIAYSISCVSQFIHAPTKAHWEAILHILRYLKKSSGTGLFFLLGHCLSLCGFSDANWVGFIDHRHSTIWYCIYFEGNLVSHKS